MIGFTVLGHAEPAGSKRAFSVRRAGVPTGRVAVADDNPKAKSWQHDVRTAAAEAMQEQADPERPGDPAPHLLDGPLSLDVRFYFARPRGHFGTGRNSAKLKPSAPTYPIVRPDTTKLVRAIEDALTGVLWRDDSLVVSQVAAKLYGEPERCVIGVYSIEVPR